MLPRPSLPRTLYRSFVLDTLGLRIFCGRSLLCSTTPCKVPCHTHSAFPSRCSRDEAGHQVEASTSMALQAASKRPMTADDVERSVGQLGDNVLGTRSLDVSRLDLAAGAGGWRRTGLECCCSVGSICQQRGQGRCPSSFADIVERRQSTLSCTRGGRPSTAAAVSVRGLPLTRSPPAPTPLASAAPPLFSREGGRGLSARMALGWRVADQGRQDGGARSTAQPLLWPGGGASPRPPRAKVQGTVTISNLINDPLSHSPLSPHVRRIYLSPPHTSAPLTFASLTPHQACSFPPVSSRPCADRPQTRCCRCVNAGTTGVVIKFGQASDGPYMCHGNLQESVTLMEIILSLGITLSPNFVTTPLLPPCRFVRDTQSPMAWPLALCCPACLPRPRHAHWRYRRWK